MSAGIKVSPKHGVNPTIPICFWCGKERGEIALLGKLPGDAEAPKNVVLDYEPCECCRAGMARGFTLMEFTDHPNDRGRVEIQAGIYPTGRLLVIKREVAKKAFGDIGSDKAYVDVATFNRLYPAE